jgi:hypothetical protein
MLLTGEWKIGQTLKGQHICTDAICKSFAFFIDTVTTGCI